MFASTRFKSLMVVGGVAALFSVSALAGDGKPGTPGHDAKPISWDEFRDRCQYPQNYKDVQKEPTNIRLQCTDTRLIWAAAAPGEVPLTGSRVVVSAVFADKFYVNPVENEFPLATKSGSCHRFKEIEETITVERQVTCAEVVGFKGSLSEFCADVTEKTKGSNPKLVDQKETGKMIDTCGGGGNQSGKPGPK